VGLELSRSAILGGAFEPCPLGTSLAKAQVSKAIRQTARESIQMHGGIGMTDEHDAGLYIKRIWCADSLHGDGSWHRNRWSRLRNY
jgi:alkylation response protein AidB-like acyl-CoA dehydrogenase